MNTVPGTAGYERSVERFVTTSRALRFRDVNRDFLAHLPSAPARMLDVGCGAGQNAAALARMGHRVTAVEPLADFLAAARDAYADLPIDWLDDSLPTLEAIGPRNACFDFILVDAVWHHLDAIERAAAMRRLAGLLDDDGRCARPMHMDWTA